MVTVRKLQTQLTNELIKATNDFEDQYLEYVLHTPQDVKPSITEYTITQGEYISQKYIQLLPILITKYRDGMIISDLMETPVVTARQFYTREYLTSVGFFDAPGNFSAPYI